MKSLRVKGPGRRESSNPSLTPTRDSGRDDLPLSSYIRGGGGAGRVGGSVTRGRGGVRGVKVSDRTQESSTHPGSWVVSRLDQKGVGVLSPLESGKTTKGLPSKTQSSVSESW